MRRGCHLNPSRQRGRNRPWLTRLLSVQILLNAAATATATAAAPAPAPDSDWWSLKPLVRPPVPHLEASSTAGANPIDTFVMAKLAERGLGLSPEADRRTLIRRIYFDLIGLPPAPAEVEAF